MHDKYDEIDLNSWNERDQLQLALYRHVVQTFKSPCDEPCIISCQELEKDGYKIVRIRHV